MTCKKCKKQIPDNVRFCSQCGAGQNADSENKIQTGQKGKSISPVIIAAVAGIAILMMSAVITAMLLITRSIRKQDVSESVAVLANATIDTVTTSEQESSEAIAEETLSEEEQAQKQDLEQYYNSLIQQNTANAFASELDMLNSYQMNAETSINNRQYDTARLELQKWQNLLAAINGQSGYDMEVEQVDASEYPRIKVYVRIQDNRTLETVKSLRIEGFYISEKVDGSSDFISREVIRATQLDNVARLNIAMLADVSGSMRGQPMAAAKTVMTDFLGSVQTQAGDHISLISFADDVRIQTAFTTDISYARNAVYGLDTYDMTALYDGLYVAIEQTAAQDGAKCVIAFTDGKDNVSQCTPSIVLEKAQRYSIPIYIIGVGNDLNVSELQYIAQSSGGFYRSVNQIGSMAEIYNAIFREQKEMYLLEYETLQRNNEHVTRNLTLDYVDEVIVARKAHQYVPSIYMEATVSMAQMFVNDFIIYDSDRRYVTSVDLDRLTKDQLRLARNEIYARKGRRFNDQSLQSYFSGKSWYKGTIAAGDFRESMLNDYERANAYYIADYERLKGYIR
ncbi:MAG: YARHG domain-containing protein [Lachnospiraceae bacterium]